MQAIYFFFLFCLFPIFSYLFIFYFWTLQKQTSKITSQSVSAQQLLPHRLKNLNPSYQSYPKKMFKKNGSCKVRLINVLFLENLEQLQKCDEKHFARVPPRGPSCGKTGLAPCRQSTFSSCFVCSPFFLIYLFFIFGPNLTKTDLQNHLPKRVCPTASSPQAQKFEPLLPILPKKKGKKK